MYTHTPLPTLPVLDPTQPSQQRPGEAAATTMQKGDLDPFGFLFLG